MRESLLLVVAKRLTALAATVVIAPTLTYIVFGALSDRLPASVPVSAWDYVVKTFWHFDLGYSALFREPMKDSLFWTLPMDVTMVAGGLLLGLGLGVVGGLVAAARPGTVASRGLQALGAVVLCCPPYWLPFLFLILFAPGFGQLVELPFVSAPNQYRDESHSVFGWALVLWLPLLMVSLPLAAQILRMTIVSMRDVGDQSFIQTARAKGISEARVLRRHALPMAVAPIAALSAANVALLITNVTLVESAWNLPGLYRSVRDVAGIQDTDTVQALIIETTVFVVVANMLADAVQAWLDPQVR